MVSSMIDRFLGDAFRVLVLEYCSVLWCSAANTHLKLLDRAVSGAQFLTGGVFECDISHRLSMAVPKWINFLPFISQKNIIEHKRCRIRF